MTETAEHLLDDENLPLRIAGCEVVEEPGNKEGGRPFGAVRWTARNALSSLG
jgi:hypothetical protein